MNNTAQLTPLSLFEILCQLLLAHYGKGNEEPGDRQRLRNNIARLTETDFENLTNLAQTNHVLVRGYGVLRQAADECGNYRQRDWANQALEIEHARIQTAIARLAEICDAFSRYRISAAVIKSLDHLPDLGSDLDMYTDASPAEVIHLMERDFQACLAPRSWGDRLACKWNFIVPGLPELVEIHVGRLGQTGEQQVIAQSLLSRTRCIYANGVQFRVCGSSERILISTLQRMYRHFYFRLCDIIDTCRLIEERRVDWHDLRHAGTAAGIWEGVATYLMIVSYYVRTYRGVSLDIPQWVLKSARFGGDRIYFAKDFLRVPVLPQSALLYGTQLAYTLSKYQINSSVRLSLLPWLATAAVVGQKVTGSDKGIW